MEKLRIGSEVLAGWLFIPSQYGFLILIVLIVLGWLYSRVSVTDKSIDKNRIITIKICVIFIITYLLFLIVSISFIDAHTPLDYRILIPVYLFFFQFIILLLSLTSKRQRSNLAVFAVLLLILLFTWKQFDRQTQFVVQSHQQGIGFADRRWIQSGIIREIQQRDKDIVVYTNAPEPFFLFSDQDAKLLPIHTFPGTRESNLNFKEELNQMQEMVYSGEAIIAYFTFVTWRWYIPSQEDLTALDHTQRIYNNSDGFILVSSGSSGR
ncbi:hypothetical protein ACFL0S_04790 [Thermodesulfobacteriota bacterium]